MAKVKVHRDWSNPVRPLYHIAVYHSEVSVGRADPCCTFRSKTTITLSRTCYSYRFVNGESLGLHFFVRARYHKSFLTRTLGASSFLRGFLLGLAFDTVQCQSRVDAETGLSYQPWPYVRPVSLDDLQLHVKHSFTAGRLDLLTGRNGLDVQRLTRIRFDTMHRLVDEATAQ